LKFDFKLLLQARQCGKLCISGAETAPAQAAEGIIVFGEEFSFCKLPRSFPFTSQRKDEYG
jgi:hypothetical protein